MEPDWAREASGGREADCWCGLCAYTIRPVADVRCKNFLRKKKPTQIFLERKKNNGAEIFILHL
jgi:hypothetical protein